MTFNQRGWTALAALSVCTWVALAALAEQARSAPILSEVLYDASGADDGRVFVEIAADPGESLDGLFVDGVNGADGAVTVSIALSGQVPDDGLFVLADRDSAGATSVAGADLLANFDFQNGPDGIVLRGGDGSTLDALGYGSFGPGTVFPGEGSPAPDAASGESLARRFADVDSGDNAADWIVQSDPTPGFAARVPEPGSLPLVAMLIAASVWQGRRRRDPSRR